MGRVMPRARAGLLTVATLSGEEVREAQEDAGEPEKRFVGCGYYCGRLPRGQRDKEGRE